MTSVAVFIIECPICQAQGDMIHHDLRSSLAYSCQNCLHEWLIDTLEESEPPAPGSQTSSANTDPPQAHKLD